MLFSLTMGGILIPFGFYLKVEQPQLDDVGTIAVIAGLVTWLMAYYTVRCREKKERQEKLEERLEYRALLNDIRQELKKLNNEKND